MWTLDSCSPIRRLRAHIFVPDGMILTDQFRMLFQTAVSAMLREFTKLPIRLPDTAGIEFNTEEHRQAAKNNAGAARHTSGLILFRNG